MKLKTFCFLFLLTLLAIQQTQIVKLNSQVNELNASLSDYATVDIVQQLSYFLDFRVDRIAYQLINVRDLAYSVYNIESTKYDWAIGLTTDQISYIHETYDPEDFLMIAEQIKNGNY